MKMIGRICRPACDRACCCNEAPGADRVREVRAAKRRERQAWKREVAR